MLQALNMLAALFSGFFRLCKLGGFILVSLEIYGGFLVSYASENSRSQTVVLDPKALKIASHSVDSPLGGVESPYTKILIDLVRNWSPQGPPKGWAQVESEDENPVHLKCIETPGNPDYIGVAQYMTIHTALQQVEEVLDDINHYDQIFYGFEDIHLVSQEGNRLLTYWEQKIPVFFIPNVSYQMQYVLDKTATDRKIYRYQLYQSGSIKKSDGLIVIEKSHEKRLGKSNLNSLTTLGEQDVESTSYYEFDFYDADWGIIKTLAPGRIWKDSVESFYLSDLAIKLRSENKHWSANQVVQESKKTLSQYPLDLLIQNKVKMTEQSSIQLKKY
jgi:hypothetical protein